MERHMWEEWYIEILDKSKPLVVEKDSCGNVSTISKFSATNHRLQAAEPNLTTVVSNKIHVLLYLLASVCISKTSGQLVQANIRIPDVPKSVRNPANTHFSMLSLISKIIPA